MAVVITRTEETVQDLRASASKASDAKAARRMLPIAVVLEGVGRKTAAETCGMERQTLRDRAHRYNDEGLDGLSARSVRRPLRSLCHTPTRTS